MKYIVYFIFISVPFYSVAAETATNVVGGAKDKGPVVKEDKNVEKQSCPKRFCSKVIGCGDSCFLHCLGALLCCKDTCCKKS